MEKNDGNEGHDCIIWSADEQGGLNHVWFHMWEERKIGIGPDQEYTVKCYDNGRSLLFRDGHVEAETLHVETDTVGMSMAVGAKFVEERRRGQPIDKGGYYLDPQVLPDPQLGDLDFTGDDE